MPEQTIGVRVSVRGIAKFLVDAKRVSRAIDDIGDQAFQSAANVTVLNNALFMLRGHSAPVAKATEQVTGGLNKNAAAADKVTKSSARLGFRLRTFLIPALISVVGWLVALAVVAGTAAVSFLGALGPLVGGLTLLPGLLFAVGAAAGVMFMAWKNGLKDMQAIKAPLSELQGTFKTTGEAAAKAMGPGLGKALTSANVVLKALSPNLVKMGTAIGFAAQGFGRMLEAPKTLGALNRVVGASTSWIRMLASAFTFLMKGMILLTDAARPLITWMFNGIRAWAQYIAKSIQAGQESGKLTKFFERTRKVMQSVGHIIRNVASGLFQIFKAGGNIQGGGMLAGLEKMTQHFRSWANSESGRKRIEQFFKDSQPAVKALGGLVGSLARAIGAIGGSGAGLKSFTAMTDTISQNFIPVLADLMIKLNSALGPAVVKLISAFTNAMGGFTGTVGPLHVMIDALALVMNAVAWLTKNVPGFAQAMVALFIAAKVAKIYSVLNAKLIIQRAQFALLRAQLASLIPMQVKQSLVSMRQAAVSGILAAKTRALALAQRLLNLAMRMSPLGIIITLIAALVTAIVILWKKNEGFRNTVKRVWTGVKTTIGTVVDGIRTVLGKIGTFMSKLAGKIKGFFTGIPDSIKGAFVGVVNFFIDGINGIIKLINKAIQAFNKLPTGTDIGELGLIDRIDTASATGNHASIESDPSRYVNTTSLGGVRAASPNLAPTRGSVRFAGAAANTLGTRTSGKVAPAPVVNAGQFTAPVNVTVNAEMDGDQITKKVTHRVSRERVRYG